MLTILSSASQVHILHQYCISRRRFRLMVASWARCAKSLNTHSSEGCQVKSLELLSAPAQWTYFTFHRFFRMLCLNFGWTIRYLSTPTIGSWWNQWVVKADHHCYLWWKCWSNSLWPTLTRLQLHLLSRHLWSVAQISLQYLRWMLVAACQLIWYKFKLPTRSISRFNYKHWWRW